MNRMTDCRQVERVTNGFLATALWLVVLLLPQRSGACAAPVFRYVLERWPVDNCKLVVFHHGPMSGPETELANMLTMRCENTNAPINVTVRWVDTDNLNEPGLQEIWRRSAARPLPWAVLLYPEPPAGVRGRQFPGGRPLPLGVTPPPGSAGSPGRNGPLGPNNRMHVAWEGFATVNELSCVLDSPARQEIVKRILSGDSAVWVFVGGGDPQRDASGLMALTSQLAQLSTDLTLPSDGGEVNPNQEVKCKLPLRVSFPVVQVTRNNPLERSFVGMLENAFQPPLPVGVPHAFLVFGKGRIMKGVAEEGLTPEAVKETCTFMVQHCSCIIKEQVQQMSFHLPIAADWRQMERPPAPPPELTVPTLAVPPPAPSPAP